jgi:hypothetical protein
MPTPSSLSVCKSHLTNGTSFISMDVSITLHISFRTYMKEILSVQLHSTLPNRHNLSTMIVIPSTHCNYYCFFKMQVCMLCKYALKSQTISSLFCKCLSTFKFLLFKKKKKILPARRGCAHKDHTGQHFLTTMFVTPISH